MQATGRQPPWHIPPGARPPGLQSCCSPRAAQVDKRPEAWVSWSRSARLDLSGSRGRPCAVTATKNQVVLVRPSSLSKHFWQVRIPSTHSPSSNLAAWRCRFGVPVGCSIDLREVVTCGQEVHTNAAGWAPVETQELSRPLHARPTLPGGWLLGACWFQSPPQWSFRWDDSL